MFDNDMVGLSYTPDYVKKIAAKAADVAANYVKLRKEGQGAPAIKAWLIISNVE